MDRGGPGAAGAGIHTLVYLGSENPQGVAPQPAVGRTLCATATRHQQHRRLVAAIAQGGINGSQYAIQNARRACGRDLSKTTQLRHSRVERFLQMVRPVLRAARQNVAIQQSQIIDERGELALRALYSLEAARADRAFQHRDVLARAGQHAIETIKPLYPEQRTVHLVTSLFTRPTEALPRSLIISRKDYRACGSLATIGFAAVRSTSQTACSHIQESDASQGS